MHLSSKASRGKLEGYEKRGNEFLYKIGKSLGVHVLKKQCNYLRDDLRKGDDTGVIENIFKKFGEVFVQ